MRLFLVFFTFFSIQGIANDIDADYPETGMTEEQQISLLINATQHSLESLQHVQVNLKAFRSQEALCIASDDNADSLYKLSSCALKLVNSIHEARVEPYFRKPFLDELEQISHTAKGKEIPPICGK